MKPKRRKFRQETVIHSYIVRPIAQEIVILIWNTPITANQVTVFRALFNAGALVCFCIGKPKWFVVGFILFQTHELLDHVDGMLARLKKQTSRTGQYLECVFDDLMSRSDGLMGATMAFGAFCYIGDFHIWYLFISFMILRGTYLQFSIDFSQQEQTEEVLDGCDHDSETFLPIVTNSLFTSMKNIFLTAMKWHNQFLLWGMLLLGVLPREYGVNAIYISYLLCSLIFLVLDLRLIFYGYIVATKPQK